MLIASNDPALDDLVRLLEAGGFAVHTARKGEEALWLARTLAPDAILLGHRLPDVSGPDLCRGLRRDPRVGPGTPILITLPAGAGPELRIDALRAHVWDLVSHPIDADELVHKLATYVEAKRHTDRAWTEGLLDAATMLYNAQGLTRRARELTAMAYRQQAPLACLALAPQLNEASPAPDAVAKLTSHVARILRSTTRQSDVTGRVESGTFAIVAPDTPETGAVGCARRLAAVIVDAQAAEADRPLPGYRVCVGYDAVDDVRHARVGADELLSRAVDALHRAESIPGGETIRRFQG